MKSKSQYVQNNKSCNTYLSYGCLLLFDTQYRYQKQFTSIIIINVATISTSSLQQQMLHHS